MRPTTEIETIFKTTLTNGTIISVSNSLNTIVVAVTHDDSNEAFTEPVLTFRGLRYGATMTSQYQQKLAYALCYAGLIYTNSDGDQSIRDCVARVTLHKARHTFSLVESCKLIVAKYLGKKITKFETFTESVPKMPNFIRLSIREVTTDCHGDIWTTKLWTESKPVVGRGNTMKSEHKQIALRNALICELFNSEVLLPRDVTVWDAANDAINTLGYYASIESLVEAVKKQS